MKLDRSKALTLARVVHPVAKKHGLTLRAVLAMAADLTPELQKHPDLVELPEGFGEYLELANLA